ncbi:AAA family ATPase [[Flexibacter] sp. ATCC 35208]|uniref:AAA family ATPase n=1 Tax=[Flexibacter] sp. ATCC 35208 TaxID=1936242 RepID=UPI0009C54262|nr:AAA family ATPase [[Flexibacter] sp. ATCC 35208]OMP75649.1 hypothetical protein BW716_28970 [[Flexibacter] sp. ATCC 35208]
MNIKNLRIKNFRCFPEKNWDLNGHFNVLIGNNATGKTAVLDAISIGIGSFFLGIDDVYAKTILYKDVRRNTFAESREYQLPCEIELSASIGEDEEILTWQRSVLSMRGNTRRDKDTNKLVNIAASLQNEARQGAKISLPVFNYYGTGRLWTEKRKVVKTIPLSSKFDAYQSAIEPIHSSAVFTSWMKTRTLTELQTQIKDEALVLVKAITSCFLQEGEKIEYDVKLDSIILNKISQGGISRIEWNELSDGYRNVIAMAADLAYRCYTLNSHFGLYAAEKSKGVILIDEIDLHLHPSWQRTIVESFKKAFPNLQFIATTHSPFIIQSLNNSELIDLQGKDMEVDYYKKGIEDITENEMHVDNPIRSEKYKQMLDAADTYYSILQNYKQGIIPDAVQKQLDEIESEFSSEPAYVALLKSERKANIK